jgi:hypothetical protein
VALQQTTRELWAQQGPFETYTIHGVPQQNIPEIYIKGAVWNAQADPPRYVAQSSAPDVTDLQGPPSERTPEQKLWDFKTRAQQYARDRESCDDVRISYLEFLETEAEDDLALARMIAG